MAQSVEELPTTKVAAPVAPPEDRSVARRRMLTFLVLCAGFVMTQLDMMIVNVAFPALEHEFRGSTVAGLSWTLNAYTIVFAALLVPAGRLSDRSSRKGGFLIGLGLFTVASALCAIAQNVPELVAARVLQAAGAAAMVPTALGLLLAAYPAEKRGGAIRAWTAVGGIAAAIAPILGGSLVNLDWRWIFLVNLPFGIAALLVGRRVLPANQEPATGPVPDLFGAVFLILGIASLALGLVKAPEWGWGSVNFVGAIAVAVASFAAFFVRSARHAHPVLPLGLLRLRSFSIANVLALTFNIAFAAMLFSFMLWAETVWGYSALKTGLALAPGTFLMPPLAFSVGKLVKRFGVTAVITTGCVLLTGALAWWAALAAADASYWSMLLPGAVLAPVGTILVITALVGVVTRDLPAPSYATGSAVNMMVRQIGLTVGVSVFIAAFGTPHGVAETVKAFQHGWVVTAALAGAAALVALLLAALPKETAAAKG
ncbi:MFS transporter [Kitasatospora sp. NPDC051984]|uniref:MFS transporter n=1 Tax=Kitasatospora sp. NPDC051984 TaxID=3364059 RepID=UPI0037CA36C1